MHEMFPRALVNCLRSGALPTSEQLGSVALHIWRDWCSGFGLSCKGILRDSLQASLMRDFAWLALTGETCGPPEL